MQLQDAREVWGHGVWGFRGVKQELVLPCWLEYAWKQAPQALLLHFKEAWALVCSQWECSDDSCDTLFLMPAESFSLIFSPHWKERFLPFPGKTQDIEFLVEMPPPCSSPPGHIQFFTVKHLQNLTLNSCPASVPASGLHSLETL